MPKTSLDAIDRKILKYLIKNARMPFLEIARECGISGAAIHQRIRKLDDSGAILGSRLVVDPKMMGFDVYAHISITLKDPQLLKQTVEQLKEIPEIVEAHFITGSGQHPRETLLRGQRTPHAYDLRRHPAYPGRRLDRDADLAAGGVPAPGEHRLHRGVVATPLSRRRRPEIPASAFVSVHAGAQAAVPGPGHLHKESTPPIRRCARRLHPVQWFGWYTLFCFAMQGGSRCASVRPRAGKNWRGSAGVFRTGRSAVCYAAYLVGSARSAIPRWPASGCFCWRCMPFLEYRQNLHSGTAKFPWAMPVLAFLAVGSKEQNGFETHKFNFISESSG